jgi:hypothetical protein
MTEENLVEEVVDEKKELKTPSYIRRNVDKYYKKNMNDNEEFKNKRKEYTKKYRERMKDNEEYQEKQRQKRKEYNDRKKLEKLNLNNNDNQ